MDLKKILYNKSPVIVQNILCSIRGYLDYKIRFGGIFESTLKLLKESEWYTLGQIETFKLKKLKDILIYSYENVPYYKKKFDEISFSPYLFNDFDDLKNIPILTKEDIRNNFDLLSSNSFQSKKIKYHTSGSTGKSLSFLISISSIQFRWAVWFRHRNRFGIKLGDNYATFTGLPAIPLDTSTPPFWRENWFSKQTIFTMHFINASTIFHIVQKLNSTYYKFYSGYPSILYSLALLIEESGLKINRPPIVIFTGAESLLDYQKEKISTIFNCIVTDQYGFSEGCANASKCELDVYHEDFELGFIECLNPIEDLDTYMGKIIVTGFTNYAMPLIRYDVGDTATWSNNKCSCGRNSNVILKINGRNEDYVLTPEGNKILRFDYIFKDTDTIFESQIIQSRIGEITIKIVPRPSYNKHITEKYLLSEVNSKISKNLKVNFEYVDHIEKSTSGKYHAVKNML